jgi:hypothetical protein
MYRLSKKMYKVITAIFDGETLHPETPLELPLNQRYQIIITPIIEVSAEETELTAKRKSIPASIAGKGKTLGDIVSPIIDEQDWECLK